MLSVVHDTDEHTDAAHVDLDDATLGLDEICRLAAREMIAVALEAERRAYLAAHADVRDQDGRRQVVGNGHHRPRQITTAAGRVEVSAPRVDDRREGHQFTSAILPPYMRRSPKVTEVLPVLYLRGLSTNDFAPALEGFFGSAAGLSASTVQRLTEAWRAELEQWSARDLSDVDFVYIWVDGVYVNVRLPDTDGAQDRLCLLVIVGVRPDGTKQLVAVTDGYREDTQSWLDVLRDLRDRGMRAPEVAVGDGALGFWAALPQVFGSTRTQKCWVHKTANVLAALPKRCHGDAKMALAKIYGAETRAAAIDAAHEFARDFDAHPKATGKITRDLDALLTFYDFPAEHWKHLRTTNVIESTFATVRLRQRTTKGPGCRDAGAAMAYKLLDAAQTRWRRINGPEFVALVRAGATFIDGKLQERTDATAQPTVEECAA
ncbi:MAG: IS256 family transposase [Actinobacteria bacterium]|nr:IS256 family transposase [Actinomycetota bacterium]